MNLIFSSCLSVVVASKTLPIFRHDPSRTSTRPCTAAVVAAAAAAKHCPPHFCGCCFRRSNRPRNTQKIQCFAVICNDRVKRVRSKKSACRHSNVARARASGEGRKIPRSSCCTRSIGDDPIGSACLQKCYVACMKRNMLSRTAKNSALLYCLRSQPVVSDFTTLNYRVTLLHI
jgi:hypothetical protein